eukprot:1182368-Prorocentrum_minimum.AAC.3
MLSQRPPSSLSGLLTAHRHRSRARRGSIDLSGSVVDDAAARTLAALPALTSICASHAQWESTGTAASFLHRMGPRTTLHSLTLEGDNNLLTPLSLTMLRGCTALQRLSIVGSHADEQSELWSETAYEGINWWDAKQLLLSGLPCLTDLKMDEVSH